MIVRTAELSFLHAQKIGEIRENLLFVVIPILDFFFVFGDDPIAVIVFITNP